jgi:hypothetical protein
MLPIIKLLPFIFTSTLILACNNGGEMSQQSSPFPSIKDVPSSAWEKLSQKKIYFGHQSVGYNIIDGIKDVMKENPQIKLNIVETSNPADLNSRIFAHSTIGKNIDPKSKVDEFVAFMRNGIGDKANIAILKYCYVDIMAYANVENIFNDYVSNISQLKIKYPELTIIHFTVPLTSIESGPKSWIKRIFGKSLDGIEDNIKRNKYNDMLIEKYRSKEPVFDLAKLESTMPDGTRSSFMNDGKLYYSMATEYTDDGGHLNKSERKIIAEQFLILISKL